MLSEGTARLYRVYPQKGAIRPGADADFTIVDPEAGWTIRNEALHSKNPLSPWNGLSGRGAARFGVLRGRVVMRDGEPQGEPGGQLVRPARADRERLARG